MNIERIKTAVRQRDGYRCTKCGISNQEHREQTGKAIEVHRIIPGSLYTVEGCITLCKRCHGPQPRRKAGQPDLVHGDNLPVALCAPAAVTAAIDALSKEERRSRAQMALILIEEGLISRGRLEGPTTP